MYTAPGSDLFKIPVLAVYLIQVLFLLQYTKPKGTTKTITGLVVPYIVEFLPPLGAILFSQMPVLSVKLQYCGLILGMFGCLFLLWSLLNLRTSFSVLPEARKLVTSGPYSFIRHPVYVGNFVWGIGIAAILQNVWYLLYVIGVFCLQYLRAREEEKVLSMLPEFQEYFSRTGRFYPKVRSKRSSASVDENPIS